MADDKPPITPSAISAQPMSVPPIPLEPPVAKPAPVATPPGKEQENKDSFRELIETIVFVVVLVLMLKTFLAEAFVIPTGSMATTLLGYHYKETCSNCGHGNLVNATSEAEPPRGQERAPVTHWKCENCGYINERKIRREVRP
jgi:signal peptidase I